MLAETEIAEVKEMIYPISLDYVPEWGLWEVVRELVSNAIDSQTEYNITVEEGNLLICDNGEGLAIRQLLMGVSEKQSENSIGQFGEGLKLALLVLTRMGYDAEIFSGTLHITNRSDMIDGIEVLKLQYTTNSQVEGTKIIIHNWNDSPTFEDRFLTDDMIALKNENGALLKVPKLFIKGVYTQELPDYLYGYNLDSIQMNRDRSTVSEWEVESAVGRIWSLIENKSVWEFLFKAGSTRKESRMSLNTIPEETQLAAMTGFKKVFGNNAVVETDENVSLEALHRKAKPINLSEFGYCIREMLMGFVGTDQDYVEKQCGDKAFKIPNSKLDPYQKKTVAILRRIGRKVGHTEIIVADLPHFDGDCNPNSGIIRIRPEVLYNRHYAISTYIHELGHLNGSRDLTENHMKNTCATSATIIIQLMKIDI